MCVTVKVEQVQSAVVARIRRLFVLVPIMIRPVIPVPVPPTQIWVVLPLSACNHLAAAAAAAVVVVEAEAEVAIVAAAVAAAAVVSYSIWQRPAPTATALSVRLAPLRKCPLAASGFLR